MLWWAPFCAALMQSCTSGCCQKPFCPIMSGSGSHAQPWAEGQTQLMKFSTHAPVTLVPPCWQQPSCIANRCPCCTTCSFHIDACTCACHLLAATAPYSAGTQSAVEACGAACCACQHTPAVAAAAVAAAQVAAAAVAWVLVAAVVAAAT
jgi:hypothetical protein